MPAISLCARCGQRYRSQLHHCTPNRVAKLKRQQERFGKFLKP